MCSELVISRFDLRDGKSDQTYGLGIKEVWEVPSAAATAAGEEEEDNGSGDGEVRHPHTPGLVQHTLGEILQDCRDREPTAVPSSTIRIPT